MKKLALIYSEYTPTIDSIIAGVTCAKTELFIEKIDSDLSKYDLVAGIGINDEQLPDSNSINVHHSLLPAFEGDEPVKQAFIAGVKVSGITFYYTKNKKIIAQYPVIISNSSHFDEIELELKYLEQTLYPIVINKLLNNLPIDSKNLLSSSNCTHNCEECGKCSH